ncbi:hypothetical protein Hanom_Chr16g01439601 [Helianthus anomalus]
MLTLSLHKMAIRSDSHPIHQYCHIESIPCGKGKDWDKGHNVYCLLDETNTKDTVVEEMAKFLREGRIGKTLTDKAIVYESHVRTFWNSARYEESDKSIYYVVRKKDENGKDVDLEMKFNVEDIRRVLELGDTDNDPTIVSERLAKGMWYRMGFTGQINGNMTKTSFSNAYKFLMHCVVHSLSHRKGAYDETSDYIMNIVTSLMLNKRYNVSQVIFEYMKENIKAGKDRYIMYPCFIMMMINDQFKDLPKRNDDIMELRNMTTETITRVTKGDDERTKRMICRINNPAYVAPENDKWRHEESNSDNEDERMSDQGSSVHTETGKEPEGVVQDDCSEEADSEATVSESEFDPTTLGRSKAKLMKKPSKKKKASDEEDSCYVPDEPKKQRAKCKAVQTGVTLRRVRVKKTGAELPKDKDGKKEKHVEMSKVQEAEKARSVEIPKEPEVQNVEVPEVVVQKNKDDDDYVKITSYKVATPPPPPPQDQPESSHPKDTSFDYLFEGLPPAAGVFKEDIPEDDYDMFNNEVVKELMKKVAELEKEKAKAEAERDALKTQIEELMMASDQVRMVLIDQEEKIKKREDDAEDNTKLFDVLQEEISKLNKKLANMNDINQTLNQMISDLHEASGNEMRAIKLEMEAMKAEKVMKDNQLNMLYVVIESHLKIDAHAAFNEIEVKRVEERRIQRERELAQEATQRRKAVVVDDEAGGSSSVVDVEMTEAEADPLGSCLSRSVDARMEEVEEETPNFILVGKASYVPYSIKEIVRQIKVKERQRKAKLA